MISDQLSVIRFEFSVYFLPITAKKPAKTQQFPVDPYGGSSAKRSLKRLLGNALKISWLFGQPECPAKNKFRLLCQSARSWGDRPKRQPLPPLPSAPYFETGLSMKFQQPEPSLE